MQIQLGKILNFFGGTCGIIICCILFSILNSQSRESEAKALEAANQNSDQVVAAISEKYDRASRAPEEGVSTGRTLGEYYSHRQYLGSPPEITHPVEVHGEVLECLLCHADGGWKNYLKSITPVTPHPEYIGCMQCHIRPVTDDLFRSIDWRSVPPPRLGSAYLPGAPPPIPHDLQMRRNCIVCHVGPGTVVAIRVEHASWGDCMQCHVTDTPVEPFRR
jgi:cytochrome c-type protein NapB